MSMEPESSHRTRGRAARSRRALLAGAAAITGLVAGETVGRAGPARADNGDPVLQGVINGSPTTVTVLQASGGNASAGLADPSAGVGVSGTGTAAGVQGKAKTGSNGHGVHGLGDGTGAGVQGTGAGGPGVTGMGGDNNVNGSGVGVFGTGGAHGGAGVVGQGGPDGGNGVFGAGTLGGTGVMGEGHPGVYGQGKAQGDDGVVGTGLGSGDGVAGFGGDSGGAGVRGTGFGTSGVGVVGTVATGNGGTGVHGLGGAAGAGVLAENEFGPALQVIGTSKFSRSGVTVVRAGSSQVTKTGVALTAESLVLATLQQHAPGIHVDAAVPHVSGSSFTIYLNKAVSANVKVAWFIVN